MSRWLLGGLAQYAPVLAGVAYGHAPVGVQHHDEDEGEAQDRMVAKLEQIRDDGFQ